MPGADHDVVADPPTAERCHNPGRIFAGVASEVDRRVEVAPCQDPGEIGSRAVGNQAFHPLAKRVRRRPSIQEGNPMPPGNRPPGQLIPDETSPTDDQDIHANQIHRVLSKYPVFLYLTCTDWARGWWDQTRHTEGVGGSWRGGGGPNLRRAVVVLSH